MSRDVGLEASYRFCGRLARREAKNFYYAFLLLPPALRRSMCALYAFMRQSDDLADEPGPVSARAAALDAWSRDLEASLSAAGAPPTWPGFPALADTVNRRAIPPIYLHQVIEGVSMDLTPRRFADFAELRGYCYRVASVVGLCCIHIWGYRSDGGRAEQLAEACGIALQLTNIIRDVKEDALGGRIYLPEDERARFGVTPEDLVAERPGPELRELLAFQARRAYDHFDQAAGLLPLVDPVGRPVLATIAGIYRALLDEIVRRDYNVLSGRVSLAGRRKLAIALRSLTTRAGRSRPRGATTPLS